MFDVRADSVWRRNGLFCDGELVDPVSTTHIDIISPSTEQIVGSVPDASPEDVDRVVKSAHRSFNDAQGWRYWTPAERAAAMDRLADLLQERDDDFSYLLAREIGRPVGVSAQRPSRPSELLRYFAALGRSTVLEEFRSTPEVRRATAVRRTRVRRESRGVTAAIVPYNGTLMMGMYKVGPTLALGGTVVIKPSPQASLEAYLFAEAALEVGIPAGVVNVVTGGRQAGEALVRNPLVDIVAFTGSTAVGRKIAEQCAALLKPSVVELGGKSAAVLLDDADLDQFAAALPAIGYTFSGQNCFIQSRIIVPRKNAAEITERVDSVSRSLSVGDPLIPETRLGPLISEAHRNRVEAHISNALSEGAILVCGGDRPDLQRGWYLNPTVFTDARPDMRICQDEVFGPVLTIIPVDSEDEAIAVANDSKYGLAGSVWSRDEARALGVASRMDTGSVGVNVFGFNTAAPFECRNDSGLGIELGPEGFSAYYQYQSVHLAE